MIENRTGDCVTVYTPPTSPLGHSVVITIGTNSHRYINMLILQQGFSQHIIIESLIVLGHEKKKGDLLNELILS